MELMFSNRTIKNMLIPLVIEQILVMLVGIADTVMISYAGEAAISGVALVDMIGYLVITVLSAVDTGGAVIVSQYLGRKERENANDSASQLVTVSFLFSLGMMIFCTLFHTLILRILFGKVMPDVMAAANTYFVITALSYPFLGLYNSAAALYRSMKKTKVTMYVSLLMNVLNITGNAIGIFMLRAGVAGVAVPTLISRAAAAVIMVGLAFQSSNEISIDWKHLLSWNRNLIGKILGIAVPNGIENGLFALGKVLVTSIVAVFGTTQIAANGIANSVDQIAILVVNAVNLAIIPVVGQCIGAGEYDQAKVYTKKLMKISYLSTAVLGGAVIVLLPLILPMFDVSEETYRLSVWLIVFHNILAFALHPTSFNLANSLRASGDVKITMYIGIGSMVLFRLGTAVIFGVLGGFGVLGVWAAMGMDWLARSVAFTIRYKSGKWRQMKTI